MSSISNFLLMNIEIPPFSNLFDICLNNVIFIEDLNESPPLHELQLNNNKENHEVGYQIANTNQKHDE